MSQILTEADTHVLFLFQISVTMTHQSTLDKLNKKTNESNENQEREACMTEILLDKVVKL